MISVTHITPHTPPVSVATMLAAARVTRFISYGFLIFLLLFGALLATHSTAQAQTPTVITYQGRLTDQNAPANGQYDLRFIVYTQDVGGAQQGSIATLDNVMVTDGVFTVQLDFGGTAPFTNSTGLFIETSIRPGASGGAYTILSPRQPLTATPYAFKAINAETATDALQLGGVAAASYVQTSDSRLADARTPTVGSSNYIQNTTSQQAAGSFNISGNGTAGGVISANAVNAQTQYNLGGVRVLSVAGNDNTFAGINAGAVNTTGFNNSFVGEDTGDSNTTGNGNSFVGRSAGTANETGNANSFIGSFAGKLNTVGDLNSFVGASAAPNNTTGHENSFFGAVAGAANTTGNNNTLIGKSANVGAGNLSYATAIGSGAVVSTHNTIALGRADGSDKVRVFGLGTAGSAHLCRNVFNEISACSSSLRYKNNIAPFRFGLSLVNRLRPITFDWRDGGMPDLGLGAEDVAAIEPLLATYNERGEVEGVKYDRIDVVLLNAVREQQAQIETLQSRLTAEAAIRARLENRLAALEKSIARRATR